MLSMKKPRKFATLRVGAAAVLLTRRRRPRGRKGERPQRAGWCRKRAPLDAVAGRVPMRVWIFRDQRVDALFGRADHVAGLRRHRVAHLHDVGVAVGDVVPVVGPAGAARQIPRVVEARIDLRRRCSPSESSIGRDPRPVIAARGCIPWNCFAPARRRHPAVRQIRMPMLVVHVESRRLSPAARILLLDPLVGNRERHHTGRRRWPGTLRRSRSR